MQTTTSEFLDRTPMRALIGIPPETLDQAMGLAYRCYKVGRYNEAEVLCKGLIAADHRYWWAYSLYAAVLRRQERNQEALVQVDRGLKFEPGQPKLVTMRQEIVAALASPSTLPAGANSAREAV
jgi:predicted Zn-dependent protease